MASLPVARSDSELPTAGGRRNHALMYRVKRQQYKQDGGPHVQTLEILFVHRRYVHIEAGGTYASTDEDTGK